MATQEPVLVEMNFSGSSSNKTGWRRVSSDGGAQLRADNVGGKSPGIYTCCSQMCTVNKLCNLDIVCVHV